MRSNGIFSRRSEILPGTAGAPVRCGKTLALLLAGAAMVSLTGPAQAQSLLDRLFNPKYQRMQELEPQARLDKQAVAALRVSAPKYFTYQPDALKTVSLAALAEVKTAAAPAGAGEVPATPLSPFDVARPALKEIRLTVLPEVAEALEAHYRESPAFLWVSEDAPNARAAAARQTLAGAAAFGLDPSDYAVGLPATIGLETDARAKALMDFEMRLSAAVLTYMLDAGRGRVDPNRISGYHDLPRRKIDLVAQIHGLQAAGNVEAFLESRQPQGEHFKALVAELAALRGAQEGERIQISLATLLKPGTDSAELANIVAAIRKNGSEALKADHAAILSAYDGGTLYGPELVDLVKAFQKENRLTPDGIVGKATIRALVGDSNADKIAKLELALERSRWLPEDLGSRRVFINQPAFTATYVESGKAPLAMRVVVGTKANQTSFFYDQIETVEYNPYWGVPYSIIVNEKLPKLAADPGYLDKIGYEVTTASGKPIPSASVDWHAVATKKLSVNVRQRPGSDNALGELKILFPNKHAIYMHDTPSKSLFNKDVRAFSHGCVRLSDPRAMAAAVLGKSKDYVASRIAGGKNESEDVTGVIPVYVAYFTAWPETDGTIGYYGDVYDRDMYLTRALEATRKTRLQARG
ncbi:L,D-transpeptidase family protein [Polymorphum gilvum]|uniref:Putative peptidoglycan binding domain protein n=1 Tax=Polymorphum gilvum (strain LMG 25793 / CGMCC 1.9160 / SL003B-26A1) TaxID=991905 RepID=F2IZR3_POLGS|nr:L,D-transpeptidase family protein [Polymorphum gilvum]ADZ70639.1 Putative peptidoglycan binding domain protein [Polymorphum gilvum SL003B-26A1]